MKKTILMMTMAAEMAVCWCAETALRSAADYVFAPPANTGCVHGVVMGDTGDYGAMRMEDFLWIKEALTERALDLSHTNRADMTNQVYNGGRPEIHLDTIGNLLEDGNDYVVGTNEITNINLIYRITEGSAPVLTNVYQYVDWHPTSNSLAFADRTMSQTLADGTTDVYTNWFGSPGGIVYLASNDVATLTATGVHAAADYIFASNRAERVSDIIQREKANSYIGMYLRGPYSRSKMTRLYSIVRLMRRKTPTAAYFNGPFTNNATDTYWEYRNGKLTSTTNRTHFLVPLGSVDHMVTMTHSQFRERDGDTYGEWHDVGEPVDDNTWHKRVVTPGNGERLYRTVYADAAVTYRAATPRVTRAKAFAHLRGYYHVTRSRNASGNPPAQMTSNETVTAECMVPLGKVVRVAGEDYLTFSVPYSRGDVTEALQVMDIPFVDEIYPIPDVPGGPEPQWVYNDDMTYRQMFMSAGVSVTFQVSIVGVYMIIELNPTTKLPNWGEYE